MGMDISATVYQEGFGEFEYEDTVDYEFAISIDQKGFPYETLDQVFCSPNQFEVCCQPSSVRSRWTEHVLGLEVYRGPPTRYT